MAIKATPLGFKKPDGRELVKHLPAIIGDNAQKAQDLLEQVLPDVAALKALGGLTPGDVSDAVTAALVGNPETDTGAAVGERLATEIQTVGTPANTALSATIAGEVEPVKADLAITRSSGREFSRSVSLRGAPVMSVARLSGGQVVPGSNADKVLIFAFEDVDTDDIHPPSPNNARMQVPPKLAGIWNFEATVRFAAIPVGSNMTVFLRKNGSELVDGDFLVTTGQRAYLRVNYTAPVVAGDYFEVVARQNTATDQVVESTFTNFKATRIGDHIGPGAGVTFDSAYKYKGFSAYSALSGPREENIDRAFTIIDDPVLGPSRQVVQLNLRPEDNEQQYPRNQMVTPPSIKSGDEFWAGFGVRFPENFPILTGDRGCTLHEIYGYPAGGFGPTVLRAQREMLAYWPEQYTNGVQFPDPAPWWMPIVRGPWTDLAFHVKSSPDPAVGFFEIWANTGAGWAQQSIGGQPRLYLATRKAGINDGGDNYSSLKITNTDPAFVGDKTMSIQYTNHKLGTSLAAVDPKSFI